MVYYQEQAFWLFATLMETILPPNFYSQTTYPQTYLGFTNTIMNDVDKNYMKITGDGVHMFNIKSFYTLFTNMENEPNPELDVKQSEIAYFFLDMLFLCGNPRESYTFCDMDSDKRYEVGSIFTANNGVETRVNIDRTSQLLVSTAIAIADIIKTNSSRKYAEKKDSYQ